MGSYGWAIAGVISCVIMYFIGYMAGKSSSANKMAREKGYRDYNQIPRHKYPPFVEPNGLIDNGGTWTPYSTYLLNMKWPKGIPHDVQNRMIADMRKE